MLTWKCMEEHQHMIDNKEGNGDNDSETSELLSGNDDLSSISLKEVLGLRNKKQQTLLLLCAGENHYSFSVPLCFAPRHHFFVEKMMTDVILVNERLCRFLTKNRPKFFMMSS